MDTLEVLRTYALAMPVMAKLAVGMAVIVGIPLLCRRIRVPGVVGLIFAGILLGPHGADVFGQQPAIADFFSDLGKLMLMFFAGLEIDLAVLRQARNRSIAFGLATTILPLLLGTAVGWLFGYPLVTAVVLGSLLASHTLLGLPIVNELGLGRREPVTVTVGATVISDTLSLIVFAICLGTFVHGFSVASVAVQLIQIAGFCATILVGLRHVGRFLLGRMGTEESAYFALLLGLLATSSVLAELIGLPGIVGAFLAGLALNSTVQEKPATTKLGFLSTSLFIPSFFVVTGFLIDPVALTRGMAEHLPLILAIVGALFVGKAAAAEILGRAFGYTWAERRTIWALTLPQVAATLAATLVAHATRDAAGEPLLDGRLLNAVLVLVVVTAMLGPWLTARFARGMVDGAGAPDGNRGRDRLGVQAALQRGRTRMSAQGRTRR